MKSVDDFVQLLNELRRERYGEQSFPITKALLYYYASIITPINEIYTESYIPKKAGGTRRIQVPCKGLKEIQSYIVEILTSLYTPESYVTGFVRGKSIVDNARPHVNHKYLVSWDIKDFFSSIHAKLVVYSLKSKPYFLPTDVAHLITDLCCIRIGEDSIKRVLPQGAPTSPILSNIVFSVADKLILDFCGNGFCSTYRRRGPITYTRYADDMTFSADYDFYYNKRFSWYEMCRVFRRTFREDLSLRHFYYFITLQLNKKKTRKCKSGQRKVVTGVVVNEKLNVKREYVREIRDLLYIWDKYGYDEAKKSYASHRRNHPKANCELLNVLVGKINFIKQVKDSNDSVYLRFRSKLKELCTRKGTSQMVSILLNTGLSLKGIMLDLDLDKGVKIQIAGIVKYIPISSIKEIVQD